MSIEVSCEPVVGLPLERFSVNIPRLNGIKEIKVFGTYESEIAISEKWKSRIAPNIVDGRLFEVSGNKDVIVVGLPYDFREKFIKGDKEKLAKALQCLFRKRRK